MVPKFDVGTLNIPERPVQTAGQAVPSDRMYNNEGDAFTLVFSLPFRREDIYAELVSPKQLGVDHSSVTIQITKRTDAAEAALQRELEASARGNEAREIKQHLAETAMAALSVGCERTVTFPDGVVVSELVELVNPSVIRWRQIASNRQTNMVGKEGGPMPEVVIALDELPDGKGTSIRMTYDFYQILKSDGTPLDGALMSKLLSQATQGWGADMVARGYETIDGADPVTARGAPPPAPSGGGGWFGFGGGSQEPAKVTTAADIGSSVLRSARLMKSDQDEEAAMKEAMRQKALASMNK